ncbi:hypothetical protein ScPMuIL_008239 [Solemya velum]
MAKQLEISRYLKTPGCILGTDPFNRFDGNWNKDCASVSLPQLTDQTHLHVACHIDDQCGRIQCCLDVVQLAQTFLVYIHLDTCQNQLEVGIEKFYRTILLADYNYGQSTSLLIAKVRVLEMFLELYNINDLGVFGMLLSTNVQICLDADLECKLNIMLLDNVALLPQQACGDFSSDFSLSAWRRETGIQADPLPTFAAAMLLEDLNISRFLKPETCVPAQSGCSETISRPVVTGPVSCHMSTCTAIDCCMDFLDRTLNFHLSIDPCLSKLSVGIENLQQQFILRDFELGVTNELNFGGIVMLNYSVVDLYASEYYLTDLTVSVCFETPTDCNDTVTVLNNTLLPKSTCQWDTGYQMNNFSLTSWKTEHGVDGDLAGYLVPLLLRELQVDNYLLVPSCDQAGNWSNECENAQLMNFPAICNFSESCETINCCVEAEATRQTFTVTMEINPCSRKLTLVIEQFAYSVSLIDYPWGSETHYDLKGLVQVKLTVNRLISQSRYLVDVTISLCYEASQPCYPELVIFDQLKLPIMSCDLDFSPGFIETNFSLSDWRAEHSDSGNADGVFPLATTLHLQHVLGIADFMEDEMCTFEISGWSNECVQSLNHTTLHNMLSCHMTSECTEIDCCMKDEHMNKTFHIYFYLNPCDFKLTVKIEKLNMEMPLLDTIFGKEHALSLKGVVRLNYLIEESTFENTYTINLNASLCFESSAECDVDTAILRDMVFDRQKCNWTTGFKQNEFSFSQWMNSSNVSISSMSELHQDKLLQDLGLTHYLSTEQCQFDHGVYNSPGNWNDECKELSLGNLGSNLACYIPNDCSGVKCCVNASEVGRFFEASFILDMCDLTLSIQLEQLSISYNLLNYKFGIREQVVINGVFGMSFVMDNNPSVGNFGVDLNLTLCFESENTCAIDESLFELMELAYPICRQNETDIFTSTISFGDWRMPACELLSNQTSNCSNYDKLPDFTKDKCELGPDCKELVCCTPMDLNKGHRNVYFTWNLDLCMASPPYVNASIEGKLWHNTVDMNKTMSLGFGELFEMKYTVESNTSEYTYGVIASFKACGLYSENGGCSVFEFLNDSSFIQCEPPTTTPDTTITTPMDTTMTTLTDTTPTDTTLTDTTSTDTTPTDTTPTDTTPTDTTLTDTTPTDTTPTDTAPPITKKRRKRDLESVVVASTLREGIQLLQKQNASNDDINAFIEQWQLKEKEEKKLNLQGSEIDISEKTIGYRTAVDALGFNDPTALAFIDNSELESSVPIQGSEAIKDMFDAVEAIAGRADQIFVVGEGLTPAGAKLLGEKLADMSFGDLEAMLDMKNLDPKLIMQFTLEIRDLCRALYSELTESLFSGVSVDEFKSFDLMLSGSFAFPKTNVDLFKYSHVFMVGGLIPMTFEFGASGFYGVDFLVGTTVLNMQGTTGMSPYGQLTCYGELGIGASLHGKLRLEGTLLDLRFPTAGEITFSKFPVDASLTMDLQLTPVSLALHALVTVEVKLPLISFIEILYKARLFSYSTPTINKRMVDTNKEEKDESPPEFSDFTNKLGHRSTQECTAHQIAGRDFTEPEFEISFRVEDDRSQVTLLLDIGTVPGGSDTLRQQELGGPSTVITTVLKHTGVPLYLTVTGTDDAGVSTTISCTLPSYDVTVPSGRFTTAFTSTSNPQVLLASVVVFEDSILTESLVSVGYSEGMYGDQILPWHSVDLTDNPMDYFTPGRDGRLIGAVFHREQGVNIPGDCAQKCLDYDEKKCLGFNYDFSPDTTCELFEAIEGFNSMIARSRLFQYFERLGVGYAVELNYEGLPLEHNQLYFFNMKLYNYLDYQNIISTEGILVDFSPPQPGLILNAVSDYTEIVDCLDVLPDDRTDWETRCVGVDGTVHNHRVIIDGPGSMTVFNGPEPLVDLLYTRANRHIMANWDGFHDDETGIFGYSWAVGREPCDDMIHPHHDPHKHLFDESQWTHTGMIHPIPEPYQILEDGKYYISVTALNKVQYGGPLSTTVCHSTPLSVDNSPPDIYKIFNIQYDETTFQLFVEYHADDPHSDLAHIDLCLGFTTRTCDVLEYKRYTAGTNITHFMPNIPDGRPIWIKLRAVNNVDMRTVKVSDQPMTLDVTAPIPGRIYDGEVPHADLQFTKDNTRICSNWENFYDHESGIAYYLLGVGTERNTTDVAELIRVDHQLHEACVILEDELLEHGKTYYNILYAFNSGHKQLNVSAASDGVTVDLTKPLKGEIVDGNNPSFEDMAFTAAKSTIAAQWRYYSDPESYIREYNVKVMKAENPTGEFEILKNWISFDNRTEDVVWRNLQLQHRDKIKIVLEIVNGAMESIEAETDGVVVDLTPPKLVHFGDGLSSGADREYQVETDSVSANFQFIDEESGLVFFKFQVFQHFQGSSHKIHPETDEWEEVRDPNQNSFTKSNLSLKSGARYSIRVGAVNGAGFVVTFQTNGVIVDATPPEIHWVRVGVLSGPEEMVDGFVRQSDNQGIKATWSATDNQSGIKVFSVAVGTSGGGTDILGWTDIGMEQNRYITNLVLNQFDTTTKSPVYYVSIKAENGAGLISEPVISTPIIILNEDKTGVAVDGAGDSDLDFQADTSTVTVQFHGFESEMYGVMSYEWAVGTTPGGEDIQPFMESGIVHREEEQVVGNGLSSSGYAQAVMSLVSGQTYYTTVRAVTNAGTVLKTVTDGLAPQFRTVDISPPVIILDSVSEEESPDLTAMPAVLYQSSTDTLSVRWHYNDSEAFVQNAWYSIGTVPSGQDVSQRHEAVISPNQISALDVGQILPDTTGKPNIFHIWATNAAGLTSKLSSASVIVDTTEPIQGSVVCPTFAVSQSPVQCTWTGFFDAESPIVKFVLTVGTSAGSSDILSPVELPNTESSYTSEGIEFQQGKRYFVMITAENAVGLTSSAISEAINIDNTPPKFGKVIELASEYRIVIGDDETTVALNTHMCGTDSDCEELDAQCQESFSTVAVAWQPFVDEESGIIR